MPAHSAFDYAVVRVVPRPERGEFINIGVILFSPARGFLGCAFELDAQCQWMSARLRALDPDVDVAAICRHLEGMRAVCAGDPDAGPVARLEQRERFHWLVSPRNTVIQISPVHAGICDDPEEALARSFAAMVRRPP